MFIKYTWRFSFFQCTGSKFPFEPEKYPVQESFFNEDDEN